MHAFTDGLKITKDGLGRGLRSIAATDGLRLTKDGLGKGLHTIASTVEHGINPGHVIQDAHDDQPSGLPTHADAPAPAAPVSPPPSLITYLTSTTSTILSGPTTAAAAAATSLVTTARSVTDTSLAITSIAQSGLHEGTDLVSLTTGPAALSGTALGSIIHAPAETSPVSLPPSLITSLTSTTSTILSGPTTAAAAAATSLATTARSVTDTGLAITSITHSGLHKGTDFVSLTTGPAALAGTALGSIIHAAAETSGTIFEPVGAGLKTLEGLEGLHLLENGVHMVNGLPLSAVKHVRELTSKALKTSGKTPTFFDSDADGIVRIPETIRGLVILGLGERPATYAAYILHTTFSYSTSESWIPSIDKSLPISVKNMSRTRWGKNWGTFERVEWVNDVDIDELKFFIMQKSFSKLLKMGRQGFGILLLFFEWGTTWPFYMPHLSIPVHGIAEDIGSVFRKAILPTIVSHFKQARDLIPHPTEVQKSPQRSHEDPIGIPGEYRD